MSNFRDPSCGGAETEDMTLPQGVSPGPNPPRFDSLAADTQLVTIGIGGTVGSSPPPPAAPVHPNLFGMQGYSAAVLARTNERG